MVSCSLANSVAFESNPGLYIMESVQGTQSCSRAIVGGGFGDTAGEPRQGGKKAFLPDIMCMFKICLWEAETVCLARPQGEAGARALSLRHSVKGAERIFLGPRGTRLVLRPSLLPQRPRKVGPDPISPHGREATHCHQRS